MKLKTLPVQLSLHFQSSGKTDDAQYTVSVNSNAKVRRLRYTVGDGAMVVREVWTCDYLPNREFNSYAALRRAYNGESK